jgi:hypothetical protein
MRYFLYEDDQSDLASKEIDAFFRSVLSRLQIGMRLLYGSSLCDLGAFSKVDKIISTCKGPISHTNIQLKAVISDLFA